MTRSRQRLIPQRRRVFVGCEGESEGGYVVLLARLLETEHRRIHLDPVLLGGGDPLAIVETAGKQLRKRAARGEPYAARLVLLDADRGGLTPERTAQAVRLAATLDMQLIWQEPCHEAFLLRHLPDCGHLRPPTSVLAMAELQRRWPEYRKALPAVRLAAQLDRSAVLRAAAFEPRLNALLQTIDFGG